MSDDDFRKNDTEQELDNPMLDDPAMKKLRDPEEQPSPQPAPAPVPESPKPKSTHGKSVLFAVLGAIAALGIAGAVYWFVLREQTSEQPPQANASENNQQEQAQEETTVADSTPVSFKSEKLNIELTHRKDWNLSESSDGAITITSPKISYPDSDGKSRTGVFTLRIRKGASTEQKETINQSVATIDSKVIGYTAPVEGQREYTNLSFAGPKNSFGFFIVTGNNEFKSGAPLMYVLNFDSSSYLIAGGFGADTPNSLSFDPVPKEQFQTSTLETAIDIVESLKIY